MLEEHHKRAHQEALALLDDIEEIGGGSGMEAVRYGDWDVKGRLSDF